MQNDAAYTATGSMARSSHRTAHRASTARNHHRTGMYGFHGSVSVLVPYTWSSTATTAATTSARRAPPWRTATHRARPTAVMLRTTTPASSPNADEPNTR